MAEWLTREQRRQAQERQLKERETAVAAGAPALAKALGGINADIEARLNPQRVGELRPEHRREASPQAQAVTAGILRQAGRLPESAAREKPSASGSVPRDLIGASVFLGRAITPKEESKPRTPTTVESVNDPLAVERAVAYVEGLPADERARLHESQWFAEQSRATQSVLYDALAEVELRDEQADQAITDWFAEAADADDYFTIEEEDAV